jgi:hypothetical protein
MVFPRTKKFCFDWKKTVLLTAIQIFRSMCCLVVLLVGHFDDARRQVEALPSPMGRFLVHEGGQTEPVWTPPFH